MCGGRRGFTNQGYYNGMPPVGYGPAYPPFSGFAPPNNMMAAPYNAGGFPPAMGFGPPMFRGGFGCRRGFGRMFGEGMMMGGHHHYQYTYHQDQAGGMAAHTSCGPPAHQEYPDKTNSYKYHDRRESKTASEKKNESKHGGHRVSTAGKDKENTKYRSDESMSWGGSQSDVHSTAGSDDLPPSYAEATASDRSVSSGRSGH